jgi:tetratricopeptide (TPR) repeat protein
MLTTNGGVAYYNKGQYDAAISDCNKAIEINPKYPFVGMCQQRKYQDSCIATVTSSQTG